MIEATLIIVGAVIVTFLLHLPELFSDSNVMRQRFRILTEVANLFKSEFKVPETSLSGMKWPQANFVHQGYKCMVYFNRIVDLGSDPKFKICYT